MTLYMAVTADEYELPLFVTESAKDMAQWAGIQVNTLYTRTCLNAKVPPHPHKKCINAHRLRKVTVDFEEGEI